MCTDRFFASSSGAGSGSRFSSIAATSLRCAGMITKKTFAAMIVPSITPTWRYAARGAKSSPAPQAASATSPVPTTASAAWLRCPTVLTEDVVDDPRERDPADAERDRLPLVEIGDARVHQADARVEVVEDDEQRESGEPRRVRLPLEPVQRLRHLGGRKAVLLRVVEATAVDAPELACDSRFGVLSPLRRTEREIESHEVEGGADPRDPGDHVEHSQDDVEDVSQVRIHRSLAIATSSRQPVSSSSSRERPSRPRSTSRMSAFERRFTNTTKRNPNFLS